MIPKEEIKQLEKIINTFSESSEEALTPDQLKKVFKDLRLVLSFQKGLLERFC